MSHDDNNNIISKKTNTKNVLLDIAPKLANTTKTIDVKAWDKLFVQQKVRMNKKKNMKENIFVQYRCHIYFIIVLANRLDIRKL